MTSGPQVRGHTAPGAAGHDGTSPPAIDVRGITKAFGAVVANDQVSLRVEQGEVHALLGENGAGKSTLMKVIFGLLRPDSGEIHLSGERVEIRSPREALDRGIGMLHQEFVLVPTMTVAENLALAATRRGLGSSGLAEARAYVESFVERSGFAIAPDDIVGDLSVGAQQRVEILKLLYRGAEVLIMDEPSAVLTVHEWEELEEMLRALVAEGKSVILITHKLDEIFAVADQCTVLRHGKTVGTAVISETTKAELARMMVGRDVVFRTTRPEREPGRPALVVRDLSTDVFERINLVDVNFEVREGEVLGIAGVEGNGQRELIEALSGLAPLSTGQVEVAGKVIDRLTPQTLTQAGGGVVTEDRRRTGLALPLPIVDNLMVRRFASPPFAHRGLLDPKAMRQYAEELVAEFDVRCESIDTPVRQLSGGNQQKLMLARELHGDTRMLIAAQPTRGLDVGAIEQVYKLLNDYKMSGGALLLISTELDEIFSLSDRIAVMCDGRLSGILTAAEATIDRVGQLMAGEQISALEGLAGGSGGRS